VSRESLPSDPAAEAGLIGSILQAPLQALGVCDDHGITSQSFHDPGCSTVYSAIKTLHAENAGIDFIAVTGHLRDRGILNETGGTINGQPSTGVAYVASLFSCIPTAALARDYAKRVHAKATLRLGILSHREGEKMAYENQEDPAEIVAHYQRTAAEIAEHWKRSKKQQPSNREVIGQIINDFAEGDEQKLFGKTLGIESLDAEVCGLLPTDLLIVAGGPSSGKSALADQICHHWAKHHKAHVVQFTFEMTQRQKLQRMIQSTAELNMREEKRKDPDLLRGDIVGKLTSAASEIAKLNIQFLDDRTHLADIRGCCEEARRIHAQAPIDLVVLDYDELIPGIKEKGGTKEQELSSIAFAWKALAGELGCPAILLSQVTEGDHGAKMRGSAAKLQAANIALLVRQPEENEAEREVIVWKSRDGRRGGKLKYKFTGKYTRFYEPDPVEEEEPKPDPKTRRRK